jgi:glycosyltransferase involved in cell wall biosynthesis
VRTLLLLTSSLDYAGPARRLCLLARGLPRGAFAVRVGVLGAKEPWADELRRAGVEVRSLGWTRLFDAKPLLALWRWLHAERPQVVHAFGSTALRAAVLCGAAGRSLVASDLLRGGAARRWSADRWLLGGVGAVIAFGAAEARCYQEFRFAADKIHTVTPGAELSEVAAPVGRISNPPLEPGGLEICPTEEDLAAGWPAGRAVLCLGPIEAHKGHRDAVWAFDILHYLFDDLRLVFVGDGPDRPRVEDFARAVGAAPFVHFLGRRPDVAPYLRRAAAVWVPSRTGGGVCAALEAMAAGRPVVATRVPELTELVADGESGCLVPPGDKASLARATRFLLDDAALARRLGGAAHRRAEEQFTAARMVAECARIYEKLGG